VKLLKSTAIIGAMTLISRLLGLARDILLARFLGASVINDALITAIKLPNLFRRMFAEGAFNAAFVPLYAGKLEVEGEEAAARFAGEAFAALFVLVTLIVIGFELTMPFSLNLVGGGLERVSSVAGQLPAYDLAVIYARITMPYLLMMCLGALMSGMLNTRHYFAVAAFVPAMLNVCWVGILIAFGPNLSEPVLARYLAIGMTASGLLQLFMLFWALKKSGIALPLRWPRLTADVKRLAMLGIPGIVAAGITQINLAVSHMVATFKAGAASWLYYADRLYQLPLAMIGIAMGIALLPAMSRYVRAGDEPKALEQLNRGLEIAAFLTLPATVALWLIPEFLIGGLLQRGEFALLDTQNAAKALKMFALGLPAFVLLKILTPAFFAREDTKTPMKFAALSAMINLALGIALFLTIGFEGLALATSIAAWVNVMCLGVILRRYGWFGLDPRIKSRLPRMVTASLIMGGVIVVLEPYFAGALGVSFIQTIAVLLALCGIGFLAYLIFAFVLGAIRKSDLTSAFSKAS